MRISTSEGVVLRVLGLKVANAGYRIEAPGVTKAEVIRGFRIVRRDETHLKFEEPGSYAVAPLDLSSDDEEEAERRACLCSSVRRRWRSSHFSCCGGVLCKV